MEAESRSMHLTKLKRQWTNVCQMEKNNRTRKEKLLQSLTEAERAAAESQSRIDELKQIKDRYKQYVTETWPALRRESRPKTREPDVTTSPSRGALELRLANSSKPMERKANLSTAHQQVVSYGRSDEQETKNVVESEAYDKIVRTSAAVAAVGRDGSSDEDGTDVEKQMAAFVTDSGAKSFVTDPKIAKEANESSSDESSSSNEIKETKSIQNRKKLSALHLGLDSDSDEPVTTSKKKPTSDKDDDFAFFD